MRLTVVGCAGSFAGPDSPASCYLVEAPFEGRTYRLLVDIGSGAFGPLQRHSTVRDIDAIALSHLHADHCFDMSGFYVMSRYHPSGAFAQIPVHGPQGTSDFLIATYGEDLGMRAQFDFQVWEDGATVQLGPFAVTSVLVNHPVEAFALRIATDSRTLVYSGDTGTTEVLAELVADADTFLCEASFVESKAATNPPDLHLTGAEAGEYATRGGIKRLLVTHIPTWTDRAEVETDVKSTWDGPYELVTAGAQYDI